MNPTHQSHPELHGFGDAKVYERAYWQKRGRQNMASGLTWKGKPRKRPLRPDLDGLHGTERHVRVNQQRAEKFMAQGLTWRGKPRKRKIKKNPLFELWMHERESLLGGVSQWPVVASRL